MWSWRDVCPPLSALGLVLSSASRMQASFVLRFPKLQWVSLLLFIGILGMLLVSELPTFFERLWIWVWNLHRLAQWSVFLSTISSSFDFSIAHLCFVFFFAASDMRSLSCNNSLSSSTFQWSKDAWVEQFDPWCNSVASNELFCDPRREQRRLSCEPVESPPWAPWRWHQQMEGNPHDLTAIGPFLGCSATSVRQCTWHVDLRCDFWEWSNVSLWHCKLN